MALCNSCGAGNNNEDVYCSECGALIINKPQKIENEKWDIKTIEQNVIDPIDLQFELNGNKSLDYKNEFEKRDELVSYIILGVLLIGFFIMLLFFD